MCYKYNHSVNNCECRFHLDVNNFNSTTFFDPVTGKIYLCCLNSMVNNFNETIIKTMCCNMDIKFIGSGVLAKAILYYITDYITKSQLKLHVAFVALKHGIQKIGTFDPALNDVEIRAKKIL